MKFHFLHLLVFSIAISHSIAQTCSCEAHLKWVKKTFEENDAGFAYALSVKGKQAYEQHNQAFFARAKKITTTPDCTKMLYEWLTFFRNGHIGIILKTQTASAPKKSSASITWETTQVDTTAFKGMLSAKKEQDLEGIWFTPPYTIGVKKGGKGYLGFIIRSDVPEWKLGEIKFRIDTAGGTMKGTFYLRDRSPEDATTVTMVGNGLLEFGRFNLRRTWPILPMDNALEAYSRLMAADGPFMDSLDDKTLYLRIPSFDISQKAAIDSVLNANKNIVRHSENLIIDLRGNGGGSDASYGALTPILYTQPIRTVGTTFYSTPVNNKRMLDFINDPKYGFDEEGKKWARSSYDKLQQHLGQFISLNSSPVSVDTLDTVMPYPKRVGVIINGGNGSTTEQFLLEAKQSAKVKLFGTTTMGVLDISNMYFVDDPCGQFQLGYSLSKSFRVPEMAIDGKGIMPDIYLDQTVPKHMWVEQVRRYLQGN